MTQHHDQDQDQHDADPRIKTTAQDKTKHKSSIETNQTGMFTVLLFGPLSTYCDGKQSLEFPAPMSMIGLFHAMEAMYPGVNAKVLKASQVVRGLEYIDFDVEGAVESVLQQGGGGARPRAGDTAGAADGAGNGGVNGRLRDDDVLIQPGDEIGFVPPVSSG